MGLPGWQVIDASPSDLLVWEAILYEAEHRAHLRDKSRAALTVRAMNGKG